MENPIVIERQTMEDIANAIAMRSNGETYIPDIDAIMEKVNAAVNSAIPFPLKAVTASEFETMTDDEKKGLVIVIDEDDTISTVPSVTTNESTYTPIPMSEEAETIKSQYESNEIDKEYVIKAVIDGVITPNEGSAIIGE